MKLKNKRKYFQHMITSISLHIFATQKLNLSMQKKLFFASLLSLCLSVSAQGYYGKLSIGYGIPLGGSESTRTEMADDYSSFERKIRGRLSAGKGLLFNLGAGKMYNQYFGLELNAAGVLLNKSIDRIETPVLAYEKIEQYHNFNLTPTIKMVIPFAMGKNNFWSKTELYARFGLVIPILNGGTVETTTTIMQSTVYRKEKIVNFFDPGFLGAVGVQAPLSEKLSVFVEVSGQNMNNKIKSSEVTGYEVNGIDMLSSLPASQKETIYHRKRITEGDNTLLNLDPNEPVERLTTITPAHNIGVNGGVIWRF